MLVTRNIVKYNFQLVQIDFTIGPTYRVNCNNGCILPFCLPKCY